MLLCAGAISNPDFVPRAFVPKVPGRDRLRGQSPSIHMHTWQTGLGRTDSPAKLAPTLPPASPSLQSELLCMQSCTLGTVVAFQGPGPMSMVACSAACRISPPLLRLPPIVHKYMFHDKRLYHSNRCVSTTPARKPLHAKGFKPAVAREPWQIDQAWRLPPYPFVWCEKPPETGETEPIPVVGEEG